MKKPIYKRKRFWGSVIMILGIVLKAFSPTKLSPVFDQVSPMLLPLLDNMEAITDTAIIGGTALAGYGVIDAKKRAKKTNRPI